MRERSTACGERMWERKRVCVVRRYGMCVCRERDRRERGMASRVVFALRVCVLSSGMVSGVCVPYFVCKRK